MRRKTFRRLQALGQAAHHYSVYVVLLDPAASTIRRERTANRGCNGAKPCVYVGMTGLTPEARFIKHKQGIKAAAIVQRYGLKLLPELYAHLNPMPFAAAAQMEKDLASDLCQQGYTVTGGH